MRIIFSLFIAILVASCSPLDREIGDEVERASVIFEQLMADQGTITVGEFMRHNARYLEELNDILSDIRQAQRSGLSNGVDEAVAYVRAVQEVIRSSEQALNAQLQADSIGDGSNPNELALASHSGDQARIQRAMRRSREHIARLNRAIGELEGAVDQRRVARVAMIEVRAELLNYLPEQRLFSAALIDVLEDGDLEENKN